MRRKIEPRNLIQPLELAVRAASIFVLSKSKPSKFPYSSCSVTSYVVLYQLGGKVIRERAVPIVMAAEVYVRLPQ